MWSYNKTVGFIAKRHSGHFGTCRDVAGSLPVEFMNLQHLLLFEAGCLMGWRWSSPPRYFRLGRTWAHNFRLELWHDFWRLLCKLIWLRCNLHSNRLCLNSAWLKQWSSWTPSICPSLGRSVWWGWRWWSPPRYFRLGRTWAHIFRLELWQIARGVRLGYIW